MVRLALGTVQWGVPYGVANRSGKPARDEVARMLGVAREHAATTLDTARSYGDSEDVIGALTGGDAAWRIVTKLAHDVVAPGADVASSLRALEDSLASSRRALRVERIDTLLLHRAEHRTVHGGALWSALRERRARGEIGRLGASAGSPDEAFALLDDPDVDALQVATSLFDQRLVRRGFFDAAAKAGKEVFVRSVLLQGAATMSPDDLPAHLAPLEGPLRALRAFCDERGVSKTTACLRFVRALPCAYAVVGAETVAQLRENLRAWRDEVLSDDDVARFAAGVPDLDERVLNPARWSERT